MNNNMCNECAILNFTQKHPLLNINICQNCVSNIKYKTITFDEIKKLYSISKNDLKNIKYDTDYNNLYLINDIDKIKKSKNNDILLRYKKRQFKRNELFKKHNIPSQDNINYNLWNYVIEDFFDYSIAKPKININTIIDRANAAVILTNLNIVKSIYLIHYFIRDKKSHPYKIIKDAIQLSRIKKKVFDIQMDNISSYLNNSDLLNWSKATLFDLPFLKR